MKTEETLTAPVDAVVHLHRRAMLKMTWLLVPILIGCSAKKEPVLTCDECLGTGKVKSGIEPFEEYTCPICGGSGKLVLEVK